jgi:F0F1-type ATP synthase assembly protein I
MDHELRCIVFPILKKIVFSQVIVITFLFKFDSSIVVSIFFCLIELKLAYSTQLGSMTRVLNFCFFLKDMFMTAGYYFLRKTMVQPRDEAHAPKLV